MREVGASGTMALTVRRVCEACNTGWLSDVEAATEPLLAPMFRGLPQLLTVDTATRCATWVLKTVLLSTLTMGDPLPLKPFHDLYASRMPSGQTVIWSGYRPDFKLLIHARPLQSKASQGSGINDGLHGMIILGHVVLGVITKFGTQPLDPMRLPGQQLRAVWPPPPVGHAVWPPPSPISDAHLARGSIRHTTTCLARSEAVGFLGPALIASTQSPVSFSPDSALSGRYGSAIPC